MSNYCDCHRNPDCEWCRLRKENKRLRRTLNFYADKSNYKVRGLSIYAPIDIDGGYEAREALGNAE